MGYAVYSGTGKGTRWQMVGCNRSAYYNTTFSFNPPQVALPVEVEWLVVYPRLGFGTAPEAAHLLEVGVSLYIIISREAAAVIFLLWVVKLTLWGGGTCRLQNSPQVAAKPQGTPAKVTALQRLQLAAAGLALS